MQAQCSYVADRDGSLRPALSCIPRTAHRTAKPCGTASTAEGLRLRTQLRKDHRSVTVWHYRNYGMVSPERCCRHMRELRAAKHAENAVVQSRARMVMNKTLGHEQ